MTIPEGRPMGRVDEHMTGDRKRQRAEVQRRQRRHRKTTADYHAQQRKIVERTASAALTCRAKASRLNVFDRRTAAEAEGRRIGHKQGSELVAYRCRVCGHWHLATKKK